MQGMQTTFFMAGNIACESWDDGGILVLIFNGFDILTFQILFLTFSPTF